MSPHPFLERFELRSENKCRGNAPASDDMNKLFARQLAKARGPTGEVDLDVLAELVSSAYDDADRGRRRTDRSIARMIEELERSQTRLLDAFDLVPEGVAVFDAEDRYVLWNRRYAEIYPESQGQIAVGMRFEDTLRAGLAQGQYPDAVGREEEWLAERLAPHAQPQASSEQRLPNGRWGRVEGRR